MSASESTTILELAEQVKSRTRPGKRAAKRSIAKLLRTARETSLDIDHNVPHHQAAVSAGNLLIISLQLIAALRLDPVGCLQLAGRETSDEGDTVLSLRTSVAQG